MNKQLTPCDYLYRSRQQKKSLWDFTNGDHDHLTEVKITVIKGSNFRDFEKLLLTRGRLRDRVPVNTGLTVL